MCLDTTRKNPLTSKKDIVCWKVLKYKDGRLLSPYKNVIWPKKGKKIKNFNIDLCCNIDGRAYYTIKKGLHAFTDKIYADCTLNWVVTKRVYKMVIPAGTPYYRGDNNDIVALEMRFKS